MESQKKKIITSLFSSERRRTGSITTTAVENQIDIKQSRIMNLPNYKKQTLGLDFAVVFQTIEIQRLSCEIESLRMKVMDSERQIRNYQSYQIQIKQLTERCFLLETHKQKLETSLHQNNIVCRQLYADCETLKEKAQFLECSLKKKDEESSQNNEVITQLKMSYSELDRIKKTLEDELKQKERGHIKSMKQIEKNHSKKLHSSMDNENNLSSKFATIEDELKRAVKERNSFKDLNNELEQNNRRLEIKCEELDEELHKNQDLMRQKQIQFEQIEGQTRERIRQLETKYEDECNEKCIKIQEVESELNEWKSACLKLQEHHHEQEQKIALHNEQVEKYQMLLNEAADEIDRLNTIIKDKIKYLDAWQLRFKELEDNFHTTERNSHALSQKYHIAQEEINKINYLLKNKCQIVEKLERNTENIQNQHKNKLHEFQNAKEKFNAIKKTFEQEKEENLRKMQENTHLKEQLNKRTIESNKIFEELSTTEINLNEARKTITNVESKLKLKNEELADLVKKLQIANSNANKIKKQKDDLRSEMSSKTINFEERLIREETRKNQLMSQVKRQFEKIKEYQKIISEQNLKKGEYEDSMEKYEKYIVDLQYRFEEANEKLRFLEQLKNEIGELKFENKDFEEQIKNMNSIIVEKVCEIASMKEKVLNYSRFIQDIKQSENKIRNQIQFIAKHHTDEITFLQNKNQKLEQAFTDLENEFNTLEIQKDQIFQEKNHQDKLLSLKNSQIQRVQNLLQEEKQHNSNYKETEKILSIKIRELEKKIKNQQNQAEKDKNQMNKVIVQLEKNKEKKIKQLEVKIKSDTENIQAINDQKEKLVKQKQKFMTNYQIQIKKMKENIENIEQQKNSLSKENKENMKRIINFQYEIKRNEERDEDFARQLQISKNNYEQLQLKCKQKDEFHSVINEKMNEVNGEKLKLEERLKEREERMQQKSEEIKTLEQSCKGYKSEIQQLQNEIKVLECHNFESESSIISLKFESDSITTQYSNLKTRLNRLQMIILKLREHIVKISTIYKENTNQALEIEKKSIQYHDLFLKKIQQFEETQYHQSEEIIRLETLNKILSLSTTNYQKDSSKLKKSQIFSSMISKKDAINEKDINNGLKKSYIEPLFLNSKKSRSRSRTTKLEDSDFQDYPAYSTQQRLKDTPKEVQTLKSPKSQKNRVYFENLVFKNM